MGNLKKKKGEGEVYTTLIDLNVTQIKDFHHGLILCNFCNKVGIHQLID